jgi:aspartyl-tRNA(Asn)/glutamyl-tRNA(Gln) amidotransferase subunit A
MLTVPAPAFKIGEKNNDPAAMYLAGVYTVFANLTGISVISIPFFKHSNGMSFVLQVHSVAKNELSLLCFSKSAEQVNREMQIFDKLHF